MTSNEVNYLLDKIISFNIKMFLIICKKTKNIIFICFKS